MIDEIKAIMAEYFDAHIPHRFWGTHVYRDGEKIVAVFLSSPPRRADTWHRSICSFPMEGFNMGLVKTWLCEVAEYHNEKAREHETTTASAS